MKKEELLQEELDKERKHLIAQIVVLMEKIEQDKQGGLRTSHSSNMSAARVTAKSNISSSPHRGSALQRFVHRH